jgi:trehalose 6-phosphate phosphatase
MRNILARGHREVLREFIWSNVLLAFDYDGTLAPIVEDPERALMRRKTRALLDEVTRLYPVIVISGRAQPDVQRLLRGVHVSAVVGNHGIEPWSAVPRHRADVERWLPKLEQELEPFRGVVIENKSYSLAIHYRQSREKKRARAAILKVAASLGPVRIVGGKQVVNVLPEGAPHKGIALERERGRLRCDTAIYVGDDETDEDVFALDQPGRLLTVRVGAKRTSAASYCIPSQRAIDSLLQALVDLRQAHGERRQGLA